MAQHNKATDPVSQAMLAIEDALSLGLDDSSIQETDAKETASAPAAEAKPLAAPETAAAAPPPSKRRPRPKRRC
jgi:hypothetical protein